MMEKPMRKRSNGRGHHVALCQTIITIGGVGKILAEIVLEKNAITQIIGEGGTRGEKKTEQEEYANEERHRGMAPVPRNSLNVSSAQSIVPDRVIPLMIVKQQGTTPEGPTSAPTHRRHPLTQDTGSEGVTKDTLNTEQWFSKMHQCYFAAESGLLQQVLGLYPPAPSDDRKHRYLFAVVMPPLGWRKSVDGAKGKKITTNQDQTDTTPVFNKPPPVPGLAGVAIEALGVTSLGIVNSTQSQPTPVEDSEAMDIDEPSTENSTPAPGASAIPTGSSSNAEMTPPHQVHLLSALLAEVEVGAGVVVEEAEEDGGEEEEAEKSVISPSVSPEEESPAEEHDSPESDASSAMGEDEFPRPAFEDASEQPEEGDTMIDADGDEDADEDGDIDADGEVDIDPDVPIDSDEDAGSLLDMDMPDQTIPDSDGDPDMSMMSVSSKRLTARQAALIAGGSDAKHVMLPEATGRKAQKTEAEIALRRSETARKRKHQDAQRLEDEKTETINRLLKKQSVRARNKKALDTPVNEAVAPGEEPAVTAVVDNRPRVPCYRWVSSARDASPTLSFSVPENMADFPHEPNTSLLAASAQPVIRPVATCAVSGCTAQRKYRLSGAPNFETGACGMDHLKLLKTQTILKIDNAPEGNPHPKTGCTGTHYLVHYKGWKQSWDEWVLPSRLLKWNDTNLTIQKNLVSQTKQAGPGAGGSSKAIGASSGGMAAGGRGAARKEGRKRGREEDEATKKPEMKLEIPDVLKVQLVDDWEAVTKSNRLVPLPRTPNVQEILTGFKDWLPNVMPSTKQRMLATVLPVIVAGLQLYFDKSVGANLLYRFERAQYMELRRRYVAGPQVMAGEPKDLSTIYGAEHLLRLIVNLPSMIAQTTMDTESVALLKEYVEYLLQYLVQERERLFLKEYEHASPHYQNISRA
ncbi:MRG protein, partial [Rhizoctonia solani]